jgi:membrane fusion protein, peptide pheromone/bacteriocin exporter
MELIPSNLTNYTLESYLIKISSRSKIIYWIIIVLVTGGIAVLPFVYVDVSVQTRGYFQSEIEKQKIYTPFHGKIILTNVKNGIKVEKGDTLLVIDSETIKAQKTAIQKRILENESSVHDLEGLNLIENPEINLDPSSFRTGRYFIEYSNMLKSRSVEYQKYQSIKAEYERNEILHRNELIPDSEYEKSLYSFRSEEENLNHVIIYHKTIWHADLTQRRNEENSLEAELEHCDEELNNRVLLAPVSGEIIQSADIQKGTVVGLNQVIAEISPGGELVATCFVNPGDIGLINPNQNVRIMVDALHYNEWGLLDARITEISDDMIIDSESIAYFRIRCKPEKTFLSLKNGISSELKKGMSLNARIVVTRRSLFNLLFDKADKWFNPYIKKQV